MIMFPILRRLVNLLGVRSIKKVPVITPSPWEARVGYKPVSFRKKWQAGSQEAGGVLSTFPQEAAHRSGMHKVLGAEPRLFLESCLPFPKEHLRKQRSHQWPISEPNLSFMSCRGALEKPESHPSEKHAWTLPGRKTLRSP